MEYLYRLYSNDFFGIGLFIVITILAFAFLVILFFGKKDEKARMEQERTQENAEIPVLSVDTNKNQEEISENIESISLTEEVQEDPVREEEVDFTKDIAIEPMVETRELSVEEEKSNSYNEKDLEFDLDLDFNSLPEEENSLEDTMSTLEEYPTRSNYTSSLYNNDDKEYANRELFSEEKYRNLDDTVRYQENEEPLLEPFDFEIPKEETFSREEPIGSLENLVEEPEIITEDPPVRKPMPTVFSSVYKNNEREEMSNVGLNINTEESANTFERVTEPVEPVIEEPKEEIKPIAPKRPEFVFPKRADMPKLNKNTDNNDSIIKF